MKNLIDYLFIDIPKLDTYVDQIKENNDIKKISFSEFEFSFFDPKFIRKTIPINKEMSEVEKVKVFIKYLKRKNQLETGFCIPEDTYQDSKFRFVHGEATQILIPQKTTENFKLSEFRIWYLEFKNISFGRKISDHFDNKEFNINLFLLNDRSNILPNESIFLSSFSSLQLFIDNYASDINTSILNINTLIKDKENQDNSSFIRRLKSAGAIILNKKYISAIYKDRSSTIGIQKKEPTITIFGYPLIVFNGDIDVNSIK